MVRKGLCKKCGKEFDCVNKAGPVRTVCYECRPDWKKTSERGSLLLCPDCGEKFEKRGSVGPDPLWCYSCADERRRQQTLRNGKIRRASIERYCPVCDRVLPAHRKYCDELCKHYGLRLKWGGIRACPECKREFLPNTKDQKYCTHECQWASMRYAPEDLLQNEGGLNKRARKLIRRLHGEALPLFYQPIKSVLVYRNSKWICGICKQPIDACVKWPDPQSPSVDHIVPLTKGGLHIYENVQATHLRCNIQKGNRLEEIDASTLET
jgi:hypothetical protein